MLVLANAGHAADCVGKTHLSVAPEVVLATVTSTFPQNPEVSDPVYPALSEAAAAEQVLVTRLATDAAAFPTFVRVIVEVSAVPPGTWSNVPVKTLIPQVELVLAALTEPPVPVPVE